MRKALFVLILLVLAGGLPASAEEVLYFTNGTSMAIRTHEVADDMIRVNLGAGAVMAFPMSMVERIVKGSQEVFVGPDYRPANQAIAGQAGAEGRPQVVLQDNTITAAGAVPARYRSGREASDYRTGQSDGYTAASSANASTRPANPFGPASRFRRAVAPPPDMTDSPVGAYRLGDTLVLGGPSPDAKPDKPTILSLGPRTETGSEPVTGDDPGDTPPPPQSD